jgi:hypothetical protein
MFILNNLSNVLSIAGHNPGIHKSLLDGIDNEENFRIAVLRNPLDTVVSTYIHTKHFRQELNTPFNPEHFNMVIDNYIRHMQALEEYSDDLTLYRFEDLERVVADLASKFAYMPTDYVFQPTQDQDNNPASVTTTRMYQSVLGSIPNHDIFSDANEIYNRLMQKALIIV